MISKNSKIEIVVDDFSHDGKGVAHYEDYVIFINNAIKGEELEIKLIKVLEKKRLAFGIITKILKRSPSRIEPKCLNKRCGGCQLQHLDYKAQLDFKKGVVEAAIKRIAKIDDIKIYSPIGMALPCHYRNKNSMPIGKTNKKAVLGFYAVRSHDIIPLEECMIQPEINSSILKVVKDWIDDFRISIYNETNFNGKLRHLVIREGDDEIMVALVSRVKNISNLKELIERLTNLSPKIKSILVNVNPTKGNRILGDTTNVIFGKNHITNRLGTLEFDIKLDTFFQINNLQTEVLYNKAIELADISKEDTVIDSYCGVGSLTLFLAQKAKKVIGFEIVENSILQARANATKNKIDNVEFVLGDVEKILPKWQQENNSYDILFIDPPRKGAPKEFWDSVIKSSPRKILYISCYPATLARDLNYLKEFGYIAKKIKPVDMFPHTFHIETITLIEKV